jgi:membrane fusion protein (multidrug efflux system)
MAIKTQEEQQKEEAGKAATPSPDASQPAEGGANAAEAAPKQKRPWILIAAAVLVVIGVIFGARYMAWSKTHVSTDDAQIASDLVQIAPQVNGTVTKVFVSDNQQVKAGQLLVQLDPATYEVAVQQAQAALDVAKAQHSGAEATVGLTSASTAAQVTEAQAGVSEANAGVQSSIADLSKAAAGTSSARAQAASALANVGSFEANYSSAVAAEHRAEDAVKAAQSQVSTAAAAVRVAQAQVRSNRSTADRASRDAARYQTLYSQGAISASVADQAASAAVVASEQLQASQDAVTQATANYQTAQANLNGARSQVDAAKAAVRQASAAVSAARDQAAAAKDAITQSLASESAYQAAIANAKAKIQQAQGQLTQAQTAPRQVHVSEANAGQAGAKIETAEADLKNAQINLSRTKLFAPVDGRISRKTVTVGNLVAPGTPLMSIIPAEQVWVVANFKETQLTDVKIGQTVDIEVDAFPGRTFHGKINSLSAGTGSTFALLPPDNATGNFTKVVQRIPVKITLDPGQQDVERLTVGMSVTATINTGTN